MIEPLHNFVMKDFFIRMEAFFLNVSFKKKNLILFYFSSAAMIEFWPSKLRVLYRSACRNSIDRYSFMLLFDSASLLMSLLKTFY